MRTSKPTAFSFPVKDKDFGGYSHPGGIIATCVVFAKKRQGVAVRDSKDPKKTTLYFTHDEWKTFVNGLKSAE